MSASDPPGVDPSVVSPVAIAQVAGETVARQGFRIRALAFVRTHGSTWAIMAVVIVCAFWLGSRLGDNLPFGSSPVVQLTSWAPVSRRVAPHQPVRPIPTTPRAVRTATPPPGSALTTININTAGVEDLHRVLGVRRTTAQRIVQYRHQHGTFANLDSLLAVPLSRSTVERIAARIVFGQSHDKQVP